MNRSLRRAPAVRPLVDLELANPDHVDGPQVETGIPVGLPGPVGLPEVGAFDDADLVEQLLLGERIYKNSSIDAERKPP